MQAKGGCISLTPSSCAFPLRNVSPVSTSSEVLAMGAPFFSNPCGPSWVALLFSLSLIPGVAVHLAWNIDTGLY